MVCVPRVARTRSAFHDWATGDLPIEGSYVWNTDEPARLFTFYSNDLHDWFSIHVFLTLRGSKNLKPAASVESASARLSLRSWVTSVVCNLLVEAGCGSWPEFVCKWSRSWCPEPVRVSTFKSLCAPWLVRLVCSSDHAEWTGRKSENLWRGPHHFHVDLSTYTCCSIILLWWMSAFKINLHINCINLAVQFCQIYGRFNFGAVITYKVVLWILPFTPEIKPPESAYSRFTLLLTVCWVFKPFKLRRIISPRSEINTITGLW